MPDFLHDDVYDLGLSQLALAENLYICSTMPTTYLEAQTTYKLATKASPVVSAPAARAGGGREVTVSAIADGTVNNTGLAGFFALCDNSASKLLAAGDLGATQNVTAGNPFTLTSFKIGIPAPTT